MEVQTSYKAEWNALCRSQAVGRFSVDGAILWANDIFCRVMGYSLEQIVGKHHDLLCGHAVASTQANRDFWRKFSSGQSDEGIYRRLRSDGETVFLSATYSPILDEGGRCAEVLLVAADVTAAALEKVDAEGKIRALERSQAIVEFGIGGTILDANKNFLALTGYRREDIIGRHHRMFCNSTLATSEEYARFWRELGKGNFQGGVYPRRTRDGQEIWLQATYNPIFDANGDPCKVLKLATDITRQISLEQEAQLRLEESRLFQGELEVQKEKLEETMAGLATIVRTIDKLASQTTILALNASIEAARAGDRGRSFAVVASEVKKLALDTRNATEMATRMMSGEGRNSQYDPIEARAA